ncbi:hypothetical protein [Thermus oshimai]
MLRALLALFLLGWTLALEAPEEVEGERGGFLSLAVKGEGTITAEAPPFLLPLTGSVEGEGLLNFLVRPEALAGTYTLLLKDARGSKAVRVRILPQAGLVLRGPPGGEGVEGERLRYTFALTNTGNAPDRVRLEVRTLLPHRLEAEVLELAPGETREVGLELQLSGRNRDTATLLAYSGLDPKVRAYTVVETVILPFRGAEDLGRQALYYRFGLQGRYGTGGLQGYAVGLGLSGNLSDYVGLNSRLAWDGTLKGEAAFRGEGFALGFRGQEGYYRLEGELGPFQAYYAFGAFAPTLGGLWQEGPLRFSFSLSALGQRANLGYAFQEGPLTLTPYLSLSRRGEPEEVRLGGGLEVRAEPREFSLSARAEYLSGFSLRVSGATRAQDPFGAKGDLAYQGGSLQGTLTLSERLDEEVRGSLTLGYSGDWLGRVGLEYRPLTYPFSLRAGLGYQRGLAWDLSARVRTDGLEAIGSLAWQTQTGLSYGLQLGYALPPFSLRALYLGRPEGGSLLLGGEVREGDLEGSLSLGYDWAQGRPSVRGALLYRPTPELGLGVQGAWNGGRVDLQALGLLELKGGFNTPEEVVQLFGGRATGWVEGVVFHDLNRDGVKGVGEPPLPGATVRVGGLEAQADGEGRYRLELYPGSYTLQVGGIPAGLAQRRRTEARVERGLRLPLDLPVETVVGVAGVVFLDQNRNGLQDEGEGPLPFARVVAQGPERRSAMADGTGRFTIGGLLPGAYTLSLDPASLPPFHEPGEPLGLELAPGPLPQVRLAARESVREVVQTFTEESLGLFLLDLPPTLPPGAELLLKVQTQGDPERVYAEWPGGRARLEPGEGGLFQAFLPVPEGPLWEIRVVAERGAARAEAQALLTVRPGPLGTLLLQPALVDPGERVGLEARLLKRFRQVEARLLGVRIPLNPKDPFTFQGELPAPEAPGIYEVELWADGVKLSTARLRVRD